MIELNKNHGAEKAIYITKNNSPSEGFRWSVLNGDLLSKIMLHRMLKDGGL
ncbi:hypothetical protein D7J91_004606 [Escherichia coli]|nr:hypothetical protein [Escherichia coli]